MNSNLVISNIIVVLIPVTVVTVVGINLLRRG